MNVRWTTCESRSTLDHVRLTVRKLAKTRAYITNELKSYGLTVSLDEFTATTPQGEKKMANIVAEIPGETKTLILLGSHYDTKYYKDMYFVGANDPAASVGNAARDRTSARQHERKTESHLSARVL